MYFFIAETSTAGDEGSEKPKNPFVRAGSLSFLQLTAEGEGEEEEAEPEGGGEGKAKNLIDPQLPTESRNE